MRHIIEVFAKRHILATLFTLMVLLLGLNSWRTLKRDMWPEVDYGHVQITTMYPSVSPEDVEWNVTKKLEDELESVTGTERITSISFKSMSLIDVIIKADVKDIDKVKDDIDEAVARVTDFPEEITEAPLIADIVGGADPGAVGQGENYALIMVGLTPYSERDRTADEIVEEIRQQTNKIEGTEKVVFDI